MSNGSKSEKNKHKIHYKLTLNDEDKELDSIPVINNKYGSIIREMIYKENEYINQRIGWLNTIQGLLFTALAFAWPNLKTIVPVLIFIGFAISILSLILLWMANSAINKLKNLYIEKNQTRTEVYDPDVIGYCGHEILSVVYTCGIPGIFFIAWITVFSIFISWPFKTQKNDNIQVDIQITPAVADQKCPPYLDNYNDISKYIIDKELSQLIINNGNCKYIYSRLTASPSPENISPSPVNTSHYHNRRHTIKNKM